MCAVNTQHVVKWEVSPSTLQRSVFWIHSCLLFLITHGHCRGSTKVNLSEKSPFREVRWWVEHVKKKKKGGKFQQVFIFWCFRLVGIVVKTRLKSGSRRPGCDPTVFDTVLQLWVESMVAAAPIPPSPSPSLQQPPGRRIPMNNVACMYKSVRKTNRAMTPAFHHCGLGKEKES